MGLGRYWDRVGIVRIYEDETPTGQEFWNLEYYCPKDNKRDPHAGKRVRRRFPKRDFSAKEIRKAARHLSSEAYKGKGYLPGRDSELPTIASGFIEALELTNTTIQTEKLRYYWAERFTEWMESKHPHIMTWDTMTPAIVQAWVQYLERDRELAFDTVRLALQPIRMTWKHLHQNHPGIIQAPPDIRLNSKKQEGVIQSLKPVEVAAVIDWLWSKADPIAPIVTLQSLAGLRVLEALHLRAQDIDLKRGRIQIRSTPLHKLKTENSVRDIPVCKEVVEALRRASKTKGVVPVGGELFLNSKGNVWTKDSIGWKWNRTRRRIATDIQNERIAKFQLHRFRSCFATMADAGLGVRDRLIKIYIGHTAKDTLGRHYIEIRIDDLKPVSDAFDGWRKLCKDSEKPVNIESISPEKS